MTTSLGLNRVQINFYGEKVIVPDDNIAKLMYYLSCVATVIEYNDPNILLDYRNYDRLNNKERQAVYELATLFDPQIFISNKIFIVNANLLPDNLSNKFVKITDETIGIHANHEIMIGGKVRKVLNFMICEPSWLNEYYHIPRELIYKENRRKLIPISPVSVTEISTTEIVTNQTEPIVITVKLRSNPVSLLCPFCRKVIDTKTEKKFNIVACCCCLFFSIYYVCIQACRGKNILCCDVVHKCPKCGHTIGEYNAC